MSLQTKRKYAHELFPEPDLATPLEAMMPYLYARAIGMNTMGTGYLHAPIRDHGFRAETFMAAALEAFVVDALMQGMTGDEAWQWAQSRCCEPGEWLYERGAVYGVDYYAIKPYPCGPEPGWHWHGKSTGDSTGQGALTRVHCPEDECPDCTEEVGE